MWDGEDCLFVGDAKYKRISERGSIPNADVYQTAGVRDGAGFARRVTDIRPG